MALTTLPTAAFATGSVGTSQLADGAVTTEKLVADVNFRNIIINGDMSIAQRGTSSTSSDFATVDRNNVLFGTIGATQSQTTDVPSNYTFNNSFKLNVDTASSATNANAQIRQIIEAQMIRSSGWNYTSSSSYLTLSFWVKCSLAGTYYAVFRSEDGTQQSISKSYTINSANTWEKKTITISGNSNITINNDNGRGLTVWFVFIAGTDNSGSSANLDSWGAFVSGNYTPDSSDAQTFLNTTNANISFTGEQLEVGTTASDFEFLPRDINLQRCQRYYRRFKSTGQTEDDFATIYGNAANGDHVMVGVPLSPTMRSVPSVSIDNPLTIDDHFRSGRTQSSANCVINGNGKGTYIVLKCGNFTSMSTGNTIQFSHNTTTVTIQFSSEL